MKLDDFYFRDEIWVSVKDSVLMTKIYTGMYQGMGKSRNYMVVWNFGKYIYIELCNGLNHLEILIIIYDVGIEMWQIKENLFFCRY
jgi:hypothetical protein